MIPGDLRILYEARAAASALGVSTAAAWTIARRGRVRALWGALAPLGLRRWVLLAAALSVLLALAFSTADVAARAVALRGLRGEEAIRLRLLGPAEAFLEACRSAVPPTDAVLVADPVYPWFVNYGLYPRPVFRPPAGGQGGRPLSPAWLEERRIRWVIDYPSWNEFDPAKARLERVGAGGP